MMAHWELFDVGVRLSHQQPSYREFVANLYECTSCHNKVNDICGLPSVCPWCGEMMDKGEQISMFKEEE